jgi:hypothetical protein
MITISADTQKMLESLKTAVGKALEKKKCLGQYAIVWDENKPAVVQYPAPKNYDNSEGEKRVVKT